MLFDLCQCALACTVWKTTRIMGCKSWSSKVHALWENKAPERPKRRRKIEHCSIYIWKLLLLINRAEWMQGVCHKWSRGRHFSPSLPGDRYLNLRSSKSDLRAEISGSIVWYDALAPRPEVLLSWHFVCACASSLDLKFLPYSWEKCSDGANKENALSMAITRSSFFILADEALNSSIGCFLF